MSARGFVALVLIVLTVCVASESAHAFRTAADLPEYADAGPVRWDDGELTYYVNEEGAPGLALPDVEAAAWRAFSTWAAPPCASLELRYAGNTSARATPDGINVVEWLRSGWAERGFSGDAVATTDLTYERTESGWSLVEADVYLNAVDHTWVIGTPAEGARDAESVLTHEVGHVGGLLHPCEFEGIGGAPGCETDESFAEATMFPLVERTAITLAEDDIAGMLPDIGKRRFRARLAEREPSQARQLRSSCGVSASAPPGPRSRRGGGSSCLRWG